MLVCKKMKLGELDESGRRSVTETDETVTIPADTVIAAVGEKPDAEALRAYGAEPNENGRVPFDCGAGSSMASASSSSSAGIYFFVRR